MMEAAWFFFVPLLWLIFFSSCFFLIGQAISVSLFKIPGHTGRFFLSSVLGMCYVILGTFLLLLVELLTVTSVLALLLLPIVVAIIYRPDTYTVPWGADGIKKYYALIALLLAFCLSVAIRVFVPESGADGLSYHLPYAKSFAHEGQLVLEPYLRYPLNALNFDLLFTLGFLFEGEILARMFTLYAACLMVVGIYCLGLVFFNAIVATVAAWIFISSQIILNIMTTAYIDVGFAVFILAAIFVLLLYQKDKNINWFGLLAVFMGVAMGTKYLGLLVVPSLLVWLFLVTNNKKSWAICVLLVLIIACPWYLRSWLISGNPIHPFGQSFFGYWLWTPLDMVHQNKDLFSLHGVERNWLNLIKLPWLIGQDTFVRIGPLNALFVLSMPLALVGVFIPGVVRQLALFGLFHVVFWFYSSQIMRYFIFAMPVFSLLTAYFVSLFYKTLMGLIAKPTRMKWTLSDKTQHILGLVFVAICLFSAVKYHHKVITKKMVATSDKHWQKMLDNNPKYQLVNAANQLSGEATMKLGFPYTGHYFKYQFKGDFFGSANMVLFTENATNDEKIRRLMQELEVTLLLIDKSYTRFVKVHHSIQNSEYFDLIFENESGYLYQIK